MRWKICRFLTALLLTLSLGIPLATPTLAKIERLRCNDRNCEFNERIGKSMTKEFRAVCSNDVYPYPQNMSIRNTDRDTTCTIKCRAHGGDSDYITKSCTNWDPLSRDRIRVLVECGGYPDTSGSVAKLCSESIRE